MSWSFTLSAGTRAPMAQLDAGAIAALRSPVPMTGIATVNYVAWARSREAPGSRTLDSCEVAGGLDEPVSSDMI